MTTPAKNTICLWYDRDAEAAAQFYAATFPNTSVQAVHRAPSDNPSSKAGEVLTVPSAKGLAHGPERKSGGGRDGIR